jgi:hypothetical protein
MAIRNQIFQDNGCPRGVANQTAGPVVNGVTVTVAAPNANTGPGLVAVITLSTTAAALNLAALFQSPTPNLYDASQKVRGQIPFAAFTLECDAGAGDAGIIFAPTQALVSGSNVPLLTSSGTVSGAGLYTPAGKECWRIVAGAPPQRFVAQFTTNPTGTGSVTNNVGDNWMGFVGSAAGVLRIYQSSPNDT